MSRNIVGTEVNYSKYQVVTVISFPYENTDVNGGFVSCPNTMVVFRIYPFLLGEASTLEIVIF